MATATYGAIPKSQNENAKLKSDTLTSANIKKKFESKQMERIVEFDEDISNLDSSCPSFSLDDTTSQEPSIARRSKDKQFDIPLDLRK